MTVTTTQPTVPRLVLLVLAGLLVPLVAAAPAHADARTDVTNDRGTAEADVRYRTELTVRGSGFQVVRGGFGGVYVMFGWVSDPRGGSWRPSAGGLTGQDYQYVPDSEDAAASAGYLRYVAFPGGATAGEANAVLSPTGGFTVDLTVPGPVFESVDRTGAVARVDCREVQCGVITIGAHGVANARNESFTPISFTEVYDDGAPAGPDDQDDPADPADAAEAPPTTPADTDEASGAADTDGAGGGTRAARRTSPTLAGAAGVTVDRTTALAGHALAFTARGFDPGEQVVAVLDDGRAAVGPLTAGSSGEVAAALQLPVGLTAGTHELRLTGAASGTEVVERFAAVATAADDASDDVSDAEVQPAAATAGPGSSVVGVLFLVGAAALLVGAALRHALVVRRARRRGAPAGAA